MAGLAVATMALALPAQAALVALWDASIDMSGSTQASGFTVDISGGGGGGFASLDNNGIFTLWGLDDVGLNLDIGWAGGADLDLAADGVVVGTWDAGLQTLSGNTATLNVTENTSCSPYGLGGGNVCDAVPGVVDFSQPFVLTSADGLSDPITFDLVNDFSFLMGNLGGVVALNVNLSNVQVVPVPAAVWLFGSALLGLGALKRRKV